MFSKSQNSAMLVTSEGAVILVISGSRCRIVARNGAAARGCVTTDYIADGAAIRTGMRRRPQAPSYGA
jgi:hypothetical protein